MMMFGIVPECLDGIAERMVCMAERRTDDRAALRLLRRASQVNTLADRLRHRQWAGRWAPAASSALVPAEQGAAG
ncbi:MAG TPA: hypothetical protein VGE72_00720 [Azospirillum sp.]